MIDKTLLINTIAPALRALLADKGHAFPMIRFEDAPHPDALHFDPQACESQDQVIGALLRAVASSVVSPTAVVVPQLGTFHLEQPPATQGRAAGKIAIVTGAAQGFGLEIAQDLAAQGACVALADLNLTGAQEAAARINGEQGANRAIGLSINVTDSASVAAAFHQVVRAWGGFDLLVSNAGVLKAGSVKSQPEKDFDFVTSVNYKGYFLCVQQAAPILAIQHQIRPEYRSDIIQINSKSGLAGSNRNGAYAGSKFGGIGLTQSFALELVEDGIKVNSICPGNFFDGPLWSDPQNGLFAQYLRTGKVPGATSIEDVKRFYEAKVPMGRGCTTPDVMKALYYLMEQQYETGQAVPVTGGQIMLSLNRFISQEERLMSHATQLPETQYAVQLIGPSELRLNHEKEVFRPTGYQILGKVEATGLCFSDLKLLKQFQQHPRKAPVISGMDLNEIEQIPSYVPGDKPTVPGHETVIRIVAVGDKVRRHKIGERCLVQTDYRGLPSALNGNASFGYNFEGGLQEYVLIDERVSRDFETDESFLLPAREDRSAAAIALVEPWACVEDSYQNPERQRIKAGGHLLVVAAPGHPIKGLTESFHSSGKPASMTLLCPESTQIGSLQNLGIRTQVVENIEAIPNSAFDDIVYFGASPETIEALASKPGDRCIVNIVTGGKQIGRPVQIGIGRVHYGQHRWIGTTGYSASDSYQTIPANGEIQDGDRCLVIGAGGPMGQMHIIRDVCSGAKDLKVFGTDFDDARLASLSEIAAPLARQNNVELVITNPSKSPLEGTFSYIAIMVPIAPVVSDAISKSMPGARINIFAGIPAPTIHPIDLDMLITKRCFLFGTSGSVLRDMKIMLEKVESGQLDTNLSVDAVSGMEGAIAGIEAVENRTLAGKIIVYPQLREMPLIPLSQLENTYPTVAARLQAGRWTKAAEEELLRVAAH